MKSKLPISGCLKSLLMSLLIVSVGLVLLWILFAFIMAYGYQYDDLFREARSNLGEIYNSQQSHFREHHSYSASFREMKWRALGVNRYAYFLPDETIQPLYGEQTYSLPPGIKPKADAKGFLVVAVRNMDADPDLDVWIIDQNDHRTHLMADVSRYEYFQRVLLMWPNKPAPKAPRR